MSSFLLQIPLPPEGSVDPLTGWLLGVVLSGLVAGITKLYLDSRAESRRKDEMIDRLLKAGLENADANRRSVSLLEEEKRQR